MMEAVTMNRSFVAIYDVINKFYIVQSNNDSLQHASSTQMSIKCCRSDNQQSVSQPQSQIRVAMWTLMSYVRLAADPKATLCTVPIKASLNRQRETIFYRWRFESTAVGIFKMRYLGNVS